jgi:UTP--glucose-1-phosphate uridylyltransferase
MQLTQAVLPVAGLGTRFLPWTKIVPKELLPIGTMPIIALLVDECLSVGIKDMCFVISSGKESIPKFFEPDEGLNAVLEKKGKLEMLAELKKYDEVHFHVVYQHEQLGDGHAILQAADWVKSDHVGVLFGDDLIVHEKTGLQQLTGAMDLMSDTERATGAMLALENVPREMTKQYGIVDPASRDGRLVRVGGLVEKPKPEEAPSTLGIVGKYVIPKSTFDVLPQVKGGVGGEIRLIDALIAQKNDIAICGWEFEGKRLDTGRPEGYKEAVQLLG